MGLYLGCFHEEGKFEMDDGRTIRTMTFNQEGFFSEKVEKHLDLCKEKGGTEMKLSIVTTPYIKESARESCAIRPEKLGEKAGMCKWCRHAFAIDKADGVAFTGKRLIHCPWCRCPMLKDNIKEVTNFSGQVSRTHKRSMKNLPSLATDETDEVIPPNEEELKACEKILSEEIMWSQKAEGKLEEILREVNYFGKRLQNTNKSHHR